MYFDGKVKSLSDNMISKVDLFPVRRSSIFPEIFPVGVAMCT